MKNPIPFLPHFLWLAPLLLGLSSPAGDAALRGLDPVALCEGEEIPGLDHLTETWGRHEYRFASEGSRDLFRSDPARWGIQWGGGCARMGPLSGQGSPDRWTVHEGRIYVFASDGCRDGFLSAPERFVEAPMVFPPADAERQLEGRGWIDKAVTAHGGAAALAAKHRLHLSTETAEQSDWTWTRDLELTSKGHLVRTSKWTPPAGQTGATRSVWVFDEEECSVSEGGDRFDLVSAEEREELRRYAHRHPLLLLWLRNAPDFEAVYIGPARLGETPVVDVLVRTQGLATRLHLDPDSAKVLGFSWRGRLREGVLRNVTEVFTEWRTIDGVQIPVGRTCSIDGKAKKSASFTWETVELLD